MTGILSTIENSDNGVSLGELQRAVNARPSQIKDALRFLAAESPSPIIVEPAVKGEKPRTYRRTLTDYELPHDMIDRLSRKKLEEWETMKRYLHYNGCLMQFLARELDDPEACVCGKCANCLPGETLSVTYDEQIALMAERVMKCLPIPIHPKKKTGKSLVEAEERFPIYKLPCGLSTRNRHLVHETGRALCYWGEDELGQMAKEGKRTGRFPTKLVDESLELIRKRWQPDPFPAWVTYVPSHAHPRLVADFAEALSGRLGLPCVEVVKKVRENQPQKTMENTTHRCRNLDGVFEITGELPDGPVLLVDDAVDSGWTFAVISALLLRAGSGPVFPFAIVSTSSA